MGFKTENELYEISVEVSKNRILLTCSNSDNPMNYEYQVTYFVGTSLGVDNIVPSAIEYFVSGDVEFLYDTDINFKRVARSSVRGSSGSSSGGY